MLRILYSIGSTLMVILIASCSTGGIGGDNSPIPGPFSHTSYTFVNTTTALLEDDRIGSIILNVEEIQRRVAARLGIEDDDKIYTLAEGTDYTLSTEIQGPVSSAQRTFLELGRALGTNKLDVVVKSTVAPVDGIYGKLQELVPSFGITLTVGYTDNNGDPANIEFTTRVSLQTVDKFPQIEDFIAFSQTSISRVSTPAIPGGINRAAFSQFLSGVIGIGTEFDSSYSYSGAWSSASFAKDIRTLLPNGVLQGGDLDVFVPDDLYTGGALNTDINIAVKIKNTISSAASEIATAADIASGTITFPAGTQLSVINGDSTDSFIERILRGADFTFPDIDNPVVSITGVDNLHRLIDVANNQTTAVITWEFTYSAERVFVIAGIAAGPAGVYLSHNLTLPEDKLDASFPRGVSPHSLAAYGLSTPTALNVPTIYFGLANATGDSCMVNDGVRDVKLDINNVNYRVRPARPINYEGPADIPSAVDCRVTAAFDGVNYQPLALPVRNIDSILPEPNPVPVPLPTGSVALGATSNSSAACGVSYNCNYATVNLAVTNVDEAPIIELYGTKTDGTRTDTTEANFSGSYEGVGNLAFNPVLGALGRGLNSVNNISHDRHVLLLLDEDYNGDMRDIASRRLVVEHVGPPDPDILFLTVSPSHGAGVFSLTGLPGYPGQYNLTVNTDNLDYEKFTTEELATNNGKAIYKITVTARDLGGRTTSRPFSFEVEDVIYAPVNRPGFAKEANIVNGTSGTPLYLLSGIQPFITGLHRIGTYSAIDPETLNDDDLVYSFAPAHVATFADLVNASGPTLDTLFGLNFALIDNRDDRDNDIVREGKRLVIASAGLSPGATGYITLMAIHKSLLALPGISGDTDADKTLNAPFNNALNFRTDPRSTHILPVEVIDDAYSSLPIGDLLLNRSAIINFPSGSLLATLAEGSRESVSYLGLGLGTTNVLSTSVRPPSGVVNATPVFEFVPVEFLLSQFSPEVRNDLASLQLDWFTNASGFSIDSATGAISPAPDFTPVFPAYHYLPIVVYIAGTPRSPALYRRNDIAVVTLEITDINRAPRLSANGSPVPPVVNRNIRENVAAGTEVYRFRIQDDNDRDVSALIVTSSNAEIGVKLEAVAGSDSGAIDAILSVVNSPDYETMPNIDTMIRVADRGVYQFSRRFSRALSTGVDVMTASFALNLTIDDVVEAPKIVATDADGRISESAAQDTTVNSLDIRITNTNDLTNFDPANLEFFLTSIAGSSIGPITNVLRAESDAGGVIILKVSDPSRLENLGDDVTFAFRLAARYGGTSPESEPVVIRVRIDDDEANSDLPTGLKDFLGAINLSISENEVSALDGAYTFPVRSFNFNPSNLIVDADDLNPFTGGSPSISLVPVIENVRFERNLEDPGIGDVDVVGLTSGSPRLLNIIDADYVDKELFGDITFAFGIIRNGVDQGRSDIRINVAAAAPATPVVFANVSLHSNVTDQTARHPAYSFLYSQSDYAPPLSTSLLQSSTSFNGRAVVNSNTISDSVRPEEGSVIRVSDRLGHPVYDTLTLDNQVYIERSVSLNSFEVNISLGSAVSGTEVLRVYSDGGLNRAGENEFSQYFNLELVNSPGNSVTDTLRITQKQLSGIDENNNTRTYNALDTIPLFINNEERRILNFFVHAGTDLTNASRRAIAQFNVEVEAVGAYKRPTLVAVGQLGKQDLSSNQGTDFPANYIRSTSNYTVLATVMTKDPLATTSPNTGEIEVNFTSATPLTCVFGARSASSSSNRKSGTSGGAGTSLEIRSDALVFVGTGDCIIDVEVSENGVLSRVRQVRFTLPRYAPVLVADSIILSNQGANEGETFMISVGVQARDPYTIGDSVSVITGGFGSNCQVEQNGVASYNAQGEATVSLAISHTSYGYCDTSSTALTIDINEGGVGPTSASDIPLMNAGNINGQEIHLALYFVPIVKNAIVNWVRFDDPEAVNLGGTVAVTAQILDRDGFNQIDTARNSIMVTFSTTNADVCYFNNQRINSNNINIFLISPIAVHDITVRDLIINAPGDCVVTVTASSSNGIVSLPVSSSPLTINQRVPSVVLTRVDSGNMATTAPLTNYNNIRFVAYITDNDPGDGSSYSNIRLTAVDQANENLEPGACDIIETSIIIDGTSYTSGFANNPSAVDNSYSLLGDFAYGANATSEIYFEVEPLYASNCKVSVSLTEDAVLGQASATTTLPDLAPSIINFSGPTVITDYNNTFMLSITVRDNDGTGRPGASGARPQVNLTVANDSICEIVSEAPQTLSFNSNKPGATSDPVSYIIRPKIPGTCVLTATATEGGGSISRTNNIILRGEVPTLSELTHVSSVQKVDTYDKHLLNVTVTKRDRGRSDLTLQVADDSNIIGCTANIPNPTQTYEGIGSTATFTIEISKNPDAGDTIISPGSCGGFIEVNATEDGVDTGTSDEYGLSNLTFEALNNEAPSATVRFVDENGEPVGSVMDYTRSHRVEVDVESIDPRYGSTYDSINISVVASGGCSFRGGGATVTLPAMDPGANNMITFESSDLGLSFTDVGTCEIRVRASEYTETTASSVLEMLTLPPRPSIITLPNTANITVDKNGGGMTTLGVTAMAQDPGRSAVTLTPRILTEGRDPRCAPGLVRVDDSVVINLANSGLNTGIGNITIAHTSSTIIVDNFQCTLHLEVTESDRVSVPAVYTSTISFRPSYQVPDLSFSIVRSGVNLTGTTSTDFPAGYSRNQTYTVVADVLSLEQTVLTPPNNGELSITFKSSTTDVCNFNSADAVTANSPGINMLTRIESTNIDFVGTGECTIDFVVTENDIRVPTKSLTIAVPAYSPRIKPNSLVIPNPRASEGDDFELQFIVQAEDGFAAVADSVIVPSLPPIRYGSCFVSQVFQPGTTSTPYSTEGEATVYLRVSKTGSGYCLTDHLAAINVSVAETGEGAAPPATGLSLNDYRSDPRVLLRNALYFEPIPAAPTIDSAGFTINTSPVDYGVTLTQVKARVTDNDELNERFLYLNEVNLTFTPSTPDICSFGARGDSTTVLRRDSNGVVRGGELIFTSDDLTIYIPGDCQVGVEAKSAGGTDTYSVSYNIPQGTPTVVVPSKTVRLSDYARTTNFTATITDGDTVADGTPFVTVTTNDGASCTASPASFTQNTTSFTKQIEVTSGDALSTCIVTVTAREHGKSAFNTFTLSHPHFAPRVLAITRNGHRAVVGTDIVVRVIGTKRDKGATNAILFTRATPSLIKPGGACSIRDGDLPNQGLSASKLGDEYFFDYKVSATSATMCTLDGSKLIVSEDLRADSAGSAGDLALRFEGSSNPSSPISAASKVSSTDLSQRQAKIVVANSDPDNVRVITKNSGCMLNRIEDSGSDTNIFLIQRRSSVGFTNCVDVGRFGNNSAHNIDVGDVEIRVFDRNNEGWIRTISDRDIPFTTAAVALELDSPTIVADDEAGVFYPLISRIPRSTAPSNHIYNYLQALRWFYGEDPPVDSVYVSRWNEGKNILEPSLPRQDLGQIAPYIEDVPTDGVFFVDMKESSSRNNFAQVDDLGSLSTHNSSFFERLYPHNIAGYLKIGNVDLNEYRDENSTRHIPNAAGNTRSFTRTYGTITKANADAADANIIQELITITTNTMGSATSGFHLQARLCRLGIIGATFGTDTITDLVAPGKLSCDSATSELVDTSEAAKIISLSAEGWTLRDQDDSECNFAIELGGSIFPIFSGSDQTVSSNAHCGLGEPSGGTLNVPYTSSMSWHFQHYIAGASDAGHPYVTASAPHYMTKDSIYLAEVYPVSTDGRQLLGKPLRVLFQIQIQ